MGAASRGACTEKHKGARAAAASQISLKVYLVDGLRLKTCCNAGTIPLRACWATGIGPMKCLAANEIQVKACRPASRVMLGRRRTDAISGRCRSSASIPNCQRKCATCSRNWSIDETTRPTAGYAALAHRPGNRNGYTTSRRLVFGQHDAKIRERHNVFARPDGRGAVGLLAGFKPPDDDARNISRPWPPAWRSADSRAGSRRFGHPPAAQSASDVKPRIH